MSGGRGKSRSGGRGGDRDGGRPTRLVIGRHPVRELLRARRPIEVIRLQDTRDPDPLVDEIVALAEEQKVRVETVPRDRLDALAPDLVHQGLVATAPPFPYSDLAGAIAAAERAGDPPLLVLLDGVTDPHNLGAIARTAEAVGAHALLIPGRRSVSVTPVAEKAAAGALAHLRVVPIGNLVRTLQGLHREHGTWSVGLDGDAPTTIGASQLLTEPLVLVVGAEGAGLAHLTRESCDELVSLPMRGRVGSLNASVAAGVALYAVRAARDATG
ncbi:MAG: 23S rRNA (guanosine(2251)-2'-O)-methyltransferase RlmB [Nitriliruptor sp.]